MKSFISEYGLLVISIVTGVAMITILLTLFISKDNSDGKPAMIVAFDGYNAYTDRNGNTINNPDSISGVSDITQNIHAPMFLITAGNENNIKTTVDYKNISVSEGTGTINLVDENNNLLLSSVSMDSFVYTAGSISDAVSLVFKMLNLADSANIILDNGNEITISDFKSGLISQESQYDMVIYTYTPLITVNENGRKTVVTKEVDAKDKFGNLVKDAAGNIQKTTTIVYDDAIVYSNLDMNQKGLAAFSIDFTKPCKHKVVLRYKSGTLKAEYTFMFINKVASQGNQINIEN